MFFFSHLRWLYSLRRAIRHKLCWDQQLWAGLWLAYYHQHSNWVSSKIDTKHWLPFISWSSLLSVAAKTWAQLSQQQLPVSCHKSSINFVSKAHIHVHKSPPLQLQATCTGNLISFHLKQFGAGVYLKNSPALETGITLATGGSGGNRYFCFSNLKKFSSFFSTKDDKSHAPPA